MGHASSAYLFHSLGARHIQCNLRRIGLNDCGDFQHLSTASRRDPAGHPENYNGVPLPPGPWFRHGCRYSRLCKAAVLALRGLARPRIPLLHRGHRRQRRDNLETDGQGALLPRPYGPFYPGRRRHGMGKLREVGSGGGSSGHCPELTYIRVCRLWVSSSV